MTDPDAAQDAELGALLERAKAREPDAETDLHDRYRRFVTRRLTEARSKRNWFWLSDIESAVQEVFAQFFKSLWADKFTYEGKRRFEGFLLRTAWFVAMNLRSKANEERSVSIYDPEDGGVRFDYGDFSEAVYDQLERKECLKRLAAAIQQLNPNRREIIERTLLGQKVREICGETGKTPASVSGLKFNALVDLRKVLTGTDFMLRCGELFNLSREV